MTRMLAKDDAEFMARFVARMRECSPCGEFYSDAELVGYASQTGPIWWQENGHNMSPEDCADIDVKEWTR